MTMNNLTREEQIRVIALDIARASLPRDSHIDDIFERTLLFEKFLLSGDVTQDRVTSETTE